MLLPRLIPCLDVDAGRVVKGVRFQHLRDAGHPATLGEAYEAQGADELVVLDVSATLEGRANQVETVTDVRKALRIPLTVGGGVRSVADALRLLEAGADKVAVNSAAVASPGLVNELSRRFGAQCTVVSVDARRCEEGGWKVVVRAGSEVRELQALDWIAEVVDRGAGEILLTSWDRDGTGDGYDLELLRAATAGVPVPVIASGGAGGVDHLVEALDAGASGLLLASLLHDGVTTVGELKGQLRIRGRELRP